MDEISCAEAQDAATEYALGILPPVEKAAVAAHILRCPACRAEVEGVSSVHAQLLDLIPGTEPPLGFDRRALSRMGIAFPHARRWFRTAAVLAAAVLLAVLSTVGAIESRTGNGPRRPATIEAKLFQGPVTVGDVYVSAAPHAWIVMSVDKVNMSGKVTCELSDTDGHTIDIGSFDLSNGSGTWGAPFPSTAKGISGVVLRDSHGQIVADASFA
jgi:hypothetical protein